MNNPFDTNRPIYLQITERLTQKIVAGEYAAGERLASVRDLAMQAGVNPNTMQRALAELEREKLIYTERTTGRFVTTDETLISWVRQELAIGIVQEVVIRMEQIGYEKGQLLALLQEMPMTQLLKLQDENEEGNIDE